MPERILFLTGHLARPRLEKVLFTSSGTEAVEAALKLGRAATGPPDDTRVVADHLRAGRQGPQIGPGGGQGRARRRRPQHLREVDGVVGDDEDSDDPCRHDGPPWSGRRPGEEAVEGGGDEEGGRRDEVGGVAPPEGVLDRQDQDRGGEPGADEADPERKTHTLWG